MFIKIITHEDGDALIVNTDNIVEVEYYPARPERVIPEDEAWEYDYPANNTLRATPAKVVIRTTATASNLTDGGDYGPAGTEVFPYTITLHGEQAEDFMVALPAYTPAKEDA